MYKLVMNSSTSLRELYSHSTDNCSTIPEVARIELMCRENEYPLNNSETAFDFELSFSNYTIVFDLKNPFKSLSIHKQGKLFERFSYAQTNHLIYILKSCKMFNNACPLYLFDSTFHMNELHLQDCYTPLKLNSVQICIQPQTQKLKYVLYCVTSDCQLLLSNHFAYLLIALLDFTL